MKFKQPKSRFQTTKWSNDAIRLRTKKRISIVEGVRCGGSCGLARSPPALCSTFLLFAFNDFPPAAFLPFLFPLRHRAGGAVVRAELGRDGDDIARGVAVAGCIGFRRSFVLRERRTGEREDREGGSDGKTEA